MNGSLKLTAILLFLLCLMLGGTLYFQMQNAKENEKTLLQGVEEMQIINEELKETNDLYKEESLLFKRELDLLKKDVERLEGSKKELEKKNDVLEEEKEELKMQLSLKKNKEAQLLAMKSNSSSTVSSTKKPSSQSKSSTPTNNSKPTTTVSNKPSTPNKSIPSGPKVAYLTFDDGPSVNTVKILDTLKRNGIKGTFFVNGKDTTQANSLYKRIVNEGHAIGNHIYSHDYRVIYKNKAAFMKSLTQLETHVQKQTGVKMNIVRYPGGSNNQVSWKYGGKSLTREIAKELSAKGYVYFDWNVDSTDASVNKQSKQKIVSSVLNNAKGKSTIIVLMHDSSVKTTTAEALPEIIEGLKKQGYSFDKITTNTYAPQFLKQ